MTTAKMVGPVIALLLIAAGPASQPTPAAPASLPPAIETAKQQYNQSVEKAKADMDALVEKAKKQFDDAQARLKSAYIQKLDQGIAAETKKGNLEGALAIREATVEGGADITAPTAQASISTKPGLIMVWDGVDKDGKKFPFARVIERIPAPMKRAARALPLKVPDGTPVIFQGFIRVQRDGEIFILNAKADAYAQIKVIIDDENLLEIDNRTENREFPLTHGLHKIAIRFAGENTVLYQLSYKRNGAPVTDYVYDPKDLTDMQIVK